MTLADIINSAKSMINGGPAPQHEFRVKDQVMIRRPVGFSGRTNEVLTGQILSLTEDNKQAVVTFARPGGAINRSTVKISQLTPIGRRVNAPYRRQM